MQPQVNETRSSHVKKFYRIRRRQRGYHARVMRRALPALLLGATCIALSPIFVRLSEAGPTATAFWRVALAVPALGVLACSSREPRRAGRHGLLLLAAGFAFAGDLAFWHSSIKLTSVANSTLLANLASLFVTLAAWMFLRQRPSRLFLSGLGAALFGVTLLVDASLHFSPTALTGDALGVVTAMFYAGYILAVKGLRDRGESTIRLMAATSTITAIILLPIAVATGEQFFPTTGAGWLTLLGLALVSHAAGQGLIAYALAHLPAAFSSVGLLLQPVVAALFAWLLLSEPVAPLQVAGGLIVLAGIYLARRGSA
jgi:drug/metabolite transporter (DMT)-like permease